jgi:hypothetical protein
MNWLASERSSVPHMGLVDAALIAEHGHRQMIPVREKAEKIGRLVREHLSGPDR